MEMDYDAFLKALREHFKQEAIHGGRSYVGEWATTIERDLDGYIRQMGSYSGKARSTVHIGHVFGPFGFEIKKKG